MMLQYIFLQDFVIFSEAQKYNVLSPVLVKNMFTY